MPTFIGTVFDDTIDGSVDPDDIYGDDGNDHLYGHGSGDEIFGEEGDDLLAGGDGDDTLDGGIGADTLWGELGNDVLEGGDGDDFLSGGSGDDVINGGTGNDTIGVDTAAINLISNGSFEDGPHAANNVNGLTGWSNTTGSPDSADDGASAESWNPANFGSDGTGYITMWGTTNGTNESMQQTLATPLSAGTTYTVQFDAISADYVSSQWFTPTDIPVTFELLDQATMTVLGSVTVQSTEYESYSFTITPTTAVSTIVIRPAGDGQGTYPSVIMDNLVMVEGTVPTSEDGDDTIDGGIGDDLIYAGAGNDVITAGDGADEIHGGAGDDIIYANEGSTGPDLIYGGAGADTIQANGNDTVDGGAGGDDNDVLNLNGSGLPGGSHNVVITGADSNGNGHDGYVEYFDSVGTLQYTLTFSEIEEIIPCFTPGTKIKTIRGEVPVEQLRVGDHVLTMEHGYQPLQWIGTRALTQTDLIRRAHLCPVRISRGALGNGLPERDMLVSPQHRVLINSAKAELWFGVAEVLVAAKHLTVLDGVEVVTPTALDGVEYLHVMCGQHEIIAADGAWTESFQPNDMTLQGADKAMRRELAELFPDLGVEDIKKTFTSARVSLRKFEVDVLFA